MDTERGNPGMVAGLLLGLMCGVLGGAPSAWFVARTTKATGEWYVTPLVITAVGLDAGEVLTWEAVSQRSIPVQFATPSNVRAEPPFTFANRLTAVPLAAGTPVALALLKSPEPGCVRQFIDLVKDAGADAPDNATDVLATLNELTGGSPSF